MAALKFITADGQVINLGQGPKGDLGDTGPSLYDVWLSQGNSGSLLDFVSEVWPELAPSAATAFASGDEMTPYLIPTNHSLVSINVPSSKIIGFQDFSSERLGVNPNGYTFTLHITTGAANVTWDTGVVVYGDATGFDEVWATVVREDDAWKVLLGAGR